MPHTIDLSKPLLEQTIVREMLGLSMTEETPKIGLDNLIKVAVHLVKTELADCNCNEDELVSLQLEYTLPHPTQPKLVESNFLEWKQRSPEQIPGAQSNRVEALSDEVLEVEPQSTLSQKASDEFLSRLAERMNEAIFAVQPKASKSSTSWQFRTNSEPLSAEERVIKCDYCKENDINKYEHIYNVMTKKTRCGSWCGSGTHKSPD